MTRRPIRRGGSAPGRGPRRGCPGRSPWRPLPRVASRPPSRSYGGRVPLGEAPLVPVGIGQWRAAGGVEPGHLLGREVPADGPEVLPQLLLVPGADDDRRDRGPLEEPVE